MTLSRAAMLCRILLLAFLSDSLMAMRTLVSPTIDSRLSGSMPGWLGEIHREETDEEDYDGRRYLEVLSWPDRVFLIHNMLSAEECEYLIQRAKPKLVRSSVVDADKGGGTVSNIRTSKGMFFARGETPEIARIEDRIAHWVMVESGQGEGFQVLDYQSSQRYDPHFDYFFHAAGADNGGNRLLTVLLYLTDVEAGGETVFPNIVAPKQQSPDSFSECALKGLAVKPKKGNAVIFWSLTTAGTLNKGSLHGSCPVIKGEKFSATKWYHVAHFAADPGEKPQRVDIRSYRPVRPPAPPGCTDASDACEGWAESGECENNAAFMIGSAKQPGSCLLSCNKCDILQMAAAAKLTT